MRLGVLDVGSNTVHLLVVDAHPGALYFQQVKNGVTMRMALLNAVLAGKGP